MSTYIEEATRNLKNWAENIDVGTFTEQYEALNHHSNGIPLEDTQIESHYQNVIKEIV